MTLAPKQYEYAIITLDLTSARSDLAEGLTSTVNTFTVLSLGGGALSCALNDNLADLIDLSDGMKIEGIPITEIYWTNLAQAGITATIFIAWVD